jgi:hypothetical protein
MDCKRGQNLMEHTLSEPPKRTPQFVSREIGAFELCVDVETWDELVKLGRLPPCVPGLERLGLYRWSWKEVELVARGELKPEHFLTFDSDGGVAGAANIGRVIKKRKKAKVATRRQRIAVTGKPNSL